MQQLAQRQLALLDRTKELRDASHVATDGSGVRKLDAGPPPFGTGTARSSPSGTFAHNIAGHTPKYVGLPPTVPKRSLPNRSWQQAAVPPSKGEPRPLSAMSSRQANAPAERPASAGPRKPSVALSPAQAMALRREVTAIREAKLQSKPADEPAPPTPVWLYALEGRPVDELLAAESPDGGET